MQGCSPLPVRENPKEGRSQGQVAQQRKHLSPTTKEGQYQEGFPAIPITPAPHYRRLHRNRLYFSVLDHVFQRQLDM